MAKRFGFWGFCFTWTPEPCNSGIIGVPQYEMTLIEPPQCLVVPVTGWGAHLTGAIMSWGVFLIGIPGHNPVAFCKQESFDKKVPAALSQRLCPMYIRPFQQGQQLPSLHP